MFCILTVFGLESSILHSNDFDPEENQNGQENSAALICKQSRVHIRSFLMMLAPPSGGSRNLLQTEIFDDSK